MKEKPKTSRPTYLAVEGPIGAGKTSLARLLAERLGYRAVLEEADENPFLSEFYRSPKKSAFQAQLFFLLSRWRQQLELSLPDLFSPGVIFDYILPKDRLFAELVLSEKELYLYQKLEEGLAKEARRPELVIYLEASFPVLWKRIKMRDRAYEKTMSPEYLEKVVEKYRQYFFDYKDTPLLVVNTDKLNFVSNNSDFALLVREIEKPSFGTRYWRPDFTDGAPLIEKREK
ncbi:MAG: deoxynucleoside kinase [candidate division Zixibacteria bacterium]|nr:deoxynucleoside kinase [candidate division Zixibacteria bacterium]MCI0595161.1 deoxynucleoside kinase [candidate division Zixibacteria bacterium]